MTCCWGIFSITLAKHLQGSVSPVWDIKIYLEWESKVGPYDVAKVILHSVQCFQSCWGTSGPKGGQDWGHLMSAKFTNEEFSTTILQTKPYRCPWQRAKHPGRGAGRRPTGSPVSQIAWRSPAVEDWGHCKRNLFQQPILKQRNLWQIWQKFRLQRVQPGGGDGELQIQAVLS